MIATTGYGRKYVLDQNGYFENFENGLRPEVDDPIANSRHVLSLVFRDE